MDQKVQEARRDAQAQRLQHQAAAGQVRNQRLCRATLARLLERLSAWGTRFQERYSSEDSFPRP